MSVRLDPTVIDQLRDKQNLTSFEKVGAKLGRSGFTIRQWYQGNTRPGIDDLVKLQFLTGRPYGTMLLISNQTQAA